MANGGMPNPCLEAAGTLLHNDDKDRPNGLENRPDVKTGGSPENDKFDGIIKSTSEDTVGWLNAWNAPHWVNIVDSLSGNTTLVDGQTNGYSAQKFWQQLGARLVASVSILR